MHLLAGLDTVDPGSVVEGAQDITTMSDRR
jgi:hypothetical protein